jgi:hypothetical protein
MKVTRVKKSSTVFKKSTAALKACFTYFKYLPDEIAPMSLLPDRAQDSLEWYLEGTRSGFANAIRICLMEECTVKSLQFVDELLDTNDDFVLSDNLEMRLHMIPLDQEVNYTGVTVELDVENKTSAMLDVTPGDFIVKKNGVVVKKEYFGKTVVIVTLRPERYLNTGPMKIVEGLGKVNAGQFSNVRAPEYAPDMKIDEPLEYDPTSFRFKVTTHRNCSVEYLIKMMHESLVGRLESYRAEMNGVDGEYVSETLRIAMGDETQLTFPNEYRSIPGMIAHYCYQLDVDIDRVSSNVKHPASDTGIIRIRHADPIKLVVAAIDLAINDLDIVLNALV